MRRGMAWGCAREKYVKISPLGWGLRRVEEVPRHRKRVLKEAETVSLKTKAHSQKCWVTSWSVSLCLHVGGRMGRFGISLWKPSYALLRMEWLSRNSGQICVWKDNMGNCIVIYLREWLLEMISTVHAFITLSSPLYLKNSGLQFECYCIGCFILLSIKEPKVISHPLDIIAVPTCHQKKSNDTPQITQLVQLCLSTGSLTLEAISLASMHGFSV